MISRSFAIPAIVEPFLATVKLFVAKLAPSEITTMFPVAGLAGRVAVNEPPLVSQIY